MSIEIRNLNYTYGAGTCFEAHALQNISFTIPDGQFMGIIGHTGSGKSTLIQHLNGLIRPSSGDILYNGVSIYSENFSMRELRQNVGLVFQYPEHQLFEESVLKDVCFGPKNQGLTAEECEERAREALILSGVPQELYDSSPFELSGGQKRRVAIAGVIAMHPKVLVLDEPTAGLDPSGRDEILGQIRELHRKTEMAVVLVSHSMEDVAEYVERIVVLNDGAVYCDGTPREVFRQYKALEELGLAAPQVTYIMHALKDCGLPVDPDITTMEEATDEICRVMGVEDAS